jgi:hypothetical protein
MALAARLVVAGIAAAEAQAIQGTVAPAVAAAGTTQATATALGADINFVTTVGAGSGVILPAMNGGDSMEVYNAGANALLLYPPVGGQIKALGTNAGYSIAVATPMCYVSCITPTQYICSQAA